MRLAVVAQGRAARQVPCGPVRVRVGGEGLVVGADLVERRTHQAEVLLRRIRAAEALRGGAKRDIVEQALAGGADHGDDVGPLLGSGARNLLQEYTAPEYLLKANHPYRIRIVVDARGTRLYVDDCEYFNTPGPLLGGGYFGFRTTQSVQKVEHFRVRRVA